MLFEGYLRAHGYRDFEFEKHFPESPQRPDYALPFEGGEILLEVKEFEADDADLSVGFGVFEGRT